MSKNIWQISVTACEDVLSTNILFETRQQADTYIALAKQYPDIVYGDIEIDKDAFEKTEFAIQPIPLQDNSFIAELENFIDDKKKEVED